MGMRRILKVIDVDSLTAGQKKEIRKILSSSQKEFAAELKLVDRAIAKQRKSKRSAKKR
jgi:hypothetical protein